MKKTILREEARAQHNELVLALLASGPKSIGVCARELRLSDRQARRAFKFLHQDGRVVPSGLPGSRTGQLWCLGGDPLMGGGPILHDNTRGRSVSAGDWPRGEHKRDPLVVALFGGAA